MYVQNKEILSKTLNEKEFKIDLYGKENSTAEAK